MDIPPISTSCEKAQLAHFSLELEAWEIENVSDNPHELTDDFQEGAVKLHSRERILRLGAKFLETTLADCESCDYYDPENPDTCPNDATLGFIKDTLTK